MATLAEVAGACLVWLKGDEFVPAGVDVLTGERGSPLGCELDFIGGGAFPDRRVSALPAAEEHPARLLRQGWLMVIDVQTPEQKEFIRSLAPQPQR